MGQLCAVFGNLEGSGIGLNFDNMTEKVSNYTFLTGLIMLVWSFFVFMLLSFYLDAIMPKEFGEKKKCCFCFTMCCKK